MTEWRSRIVGTGTEAPDQLLANPKNWRIHPKAQQDALAGVLTEVGWVQNVIVNQRTGHVVDGHARVEIAISRGEAEVPVVYVDLDENEEGIVLAALDPLAAMAGTDSEKWAALLAEISVSDEALKAMLTAGKPAEGHTNPDAVPPVPEEPTTKPGDLWLLGEHRLLCGDSTKDVGRLCGGTLPELCLTDPPYGISIVNPLSGLTGGEGGPTPYGGKKRLGSTNGAKPYGNGKAGTVGGPGLVAPRIYQTITGDDQPFQPEHLLGIANHQIIFGANYFASKLPDGKAWLVWDKDVYGNFSEVELAWTSHEGRLRKYRHVWSGLRREGSRDVELAERVHPTQKPVGLFEQILTDFSKDGDLIIDPYLGSGTTLIACERLGRRCYAMEIEPRYVDVAVKRWEDFTGKKAVLEGAKKKRKAVAVG